jgi:hypothetical protein
VAPEDPSKVINWDCLVAGGVEGSGTTGWALEEAFLTGGFFAATAGFAGFDAVLVTGFVGFEAWMVLVLDGVRFIVCSRATSGTGRSNALHHPRFKSFEQCP